MLVNWNTIVATMAGHIRRFSKICTLHQTFQHAIKPLAIPNHQQNLHYRHTHTHWNNAVSAAEKVVGYPTSFMSLRFWLSDEMSNVAVNMRKLIGTRHPLMKTAKGLLFDNKENMQTRGLVVLLISKAAGYPENVRDFPHHPLDGSYTPLDVTSEGMANGNGILSTQRSLAEITEMINTAFVLHKGVMNIDLSDKKRPFESETEDLLYGNKMALLSGDYLLAKASSGLSTLGNTYVVQVMASAITDLMESGFFFSDTNVDINPPDLHMWENWAYKNGGCLYAKSCQSSLMLSQHPESVSDKAFEFGKYFGLLRQIKANNEELKLVDSASCTGQASIYNILSTSEISKLKEDYTIKAKDSLLVLPNAEANEALMNIVTALSDSIQS